MNGIFRPFLYLFFLAVFPGLLISCGTKTLDVTITPSKNGYSALINQNAIVIQDPDFTGIGIIPSIIILGTLNSALIQKIEGQKVRELNYPDQDKKPGYLKSALDHLKKQHVKTHVLRQNSYVPLGSVELIVLAPHDKSVYDEASHLTFKLILGRKSFIFAPVLDEALVETLTRSYGKGGLRTDFLVVSELKNVSREEAGKFFGNPQIIVMSETDPKTSLHFKEVF